MSKEVNITINVEDEVFEKLCVDGIKSLPKEKLDDVLIEGIKHALGLKEQRNGYFESSSCGILVEGSPYNQVPTPLFKKILDKFDYDKYLGEITETVVRYIQDNYKEIVQDSIFVSFMDMLSDREVFSQARNHFDGKRYYYNKDR